MKRFLLFANCLLLTVDCFSQLPDCDIWLFDIKDSTGQISVLNPVNITGRKGYDNQPVFSPDGKYILYSSQRDSGGPTDIYKYDLATKKTTPFTQTPTSEYSPAFTPDGKSVSVVMVEKDSAQRLWQFPLSGGGPVCVMKSTDLIGYYCWIHQNLVALHILTKPAATLQVSGINAPKPHVVEDSIGRCLKMSGTLWFTTKAGHFNNVYEYDHRENTLHKRGMVESEDFCFYKKEFWSFSDDAIVSGFMNSKTGATEVVTLGFFGIRKPARLAVSPDGKRLAVVSIK